MRGNQADGYAIMDMKCNHFYYSFCLFTAYISFMNVNQTIGLVIHFHPLPPNCMTFIILSQHASPHFSHSVQNVGTVSPHLSITSPSHLSPVSGPAQVDQLRSCNKPHMHMVKSSEPSTSIYPPQEPLLKHYSLFIWHNPVNDNLIHL